MILSNFCNGVDIMGGRGGRKKLCNIFFFDGFSLCPKAYAK